MRHSPTIIHGKRSRGAVTRLTLFWVFLFAIGSVLLVGSSQSAASRNARESKSNLANSERQLGRRLDARAAAAARARAAMPVHAPSPLVAIDVDRTDDTAAASLCTVTPNDCSLRGAISFANAVPGTTINIPAGTYQLTISGAGEGFSGNNSIGDLDIRGNNTTIAGAGAGLTIIQQTTPNDRVIEINPFLDAAFTTSISGVTITGGHETAGVGGGGIVSGAVNNVTTISNCEFSGNSATGAGTFGGGAINNTGGSLSISGTSFSGNSTSGSGGAISYTAGDLLGRASVGSLTATTSSFSNNTAQSSSAGGGAIDIFNINLGTTSAQVRTSGFTANSAANGRGGAVILESGSADVGFSRLVGNTSASGGRAVHRVSGTFTADNNWWGLNSGPAANANSGGAILTWLQLRAVASPNEACAGATVNVAADIYGTNGMNPVPNCPGASCALNGLPAFAGTVAGTATQFVNGAASGSFIAGSGSPSATADSETVSAQFTLDQAAAIVTQPQSSTVCDGQTATFTVAVSGTSPSIQWQVSTNGGGSFTNLPGETNNTLSFTATAAQSGNQYRAVVTNSCGSVTSNAATLTVDTAPTVSSNPANQTVCAGASASFTASAGGSASTVQWQVSTNGGASFSNISGATNQTLSFTTSSSQSGNQYRAVFTNACGSATTTAATLTVNTAPAVTTNPANQTVCEGAMASFSAAASGSPSPTVQWQVSTNGGGSFSDIPGATSATYTFTTAAGQSGNQYRAVFTNSCGSATSTAAALTVNTAPVVTQNPQSQTVTSGNATFTAAASGSPTPTVQWQESTNGGASFTNIPGATSTTLTVPADEAHNGRQYRAVFTNICGSATTTAATLTTCQAPVINIATSNISMWPPNHQYHTFDASSFGATASSNCDGDLTSSIYIVSVSSDEPENNPLGADGSTLNDIIIAADCKSVQLRNERDGNLNGRVYTITFKVTDSHGNSTTATATISVPVNQNGASAVNDGPGAGYTVNSACP